jgi:hypothetical protein
MGHEDRGFDGAVVVDGESGLMVAMCCDYAWWKWFDVP